MFNMQYASKIIRNASHRGNWISLLHFFMLPTWILRTKHPLMSIVAKPKICRWKWRRTWSWWGAWLLTFDLVIRITTPQDRKFSEEVGTGVEMENNSTCLNYFELFFTDVYQLILTDTIQFQCQKSHLDHNSQGHLHNLTVMVLTAWLSLTLVMGLLKKQLEVLLV